MQGNSSEELLKLSISAEASIFLVTFTSLQTITGSIGNCIVVITVLAAKELRRRSEDQLILNLAVADFLSLTTFLPWHIYLLSQGSISQSQHRVYEALHSLVFYYGGNAIFAIAIDRFVAIVLPLRHKNIMTNKSTFVVAVLTFGIAAALAIDDFLGLQITPQTKWMNFSLFPYDLLLALAIGILYIIIFYTALKQSRNILKQRQSVGAECENFSSRLIFRIARKTFLLVLLYYTTYLPSFIYIFYAYAGTDQARIHQVTTRTWFYSFVFLSSCVNPFVYALRTKRFKAAFYKKIWSKMCH